MKAWLAVALLAVASVCGATEQVASIATRPNVSLAYLVVRDGSTAPKVVVISFPGGFGAVDLVKRAESGGVNFGPAANFLIRTRGAMADADFVDVIVDAPSDQLPNGMRDDFRLSADHATDIRALATELKKQFPDARLYLVGTSRGTISAASVGASLGDVVQGVILTSTVTNANKQGPGLSTFDFAKLKVPVLIVHHHDDGCVVSPYSGVEALGKRFSLVTVYGGDPPQSGPCDPQAAHGYFGRDAPVVAAMKDWMMGRSPPREIH
jgi:hypothetical protein